MGWMRGGMALAWLGAALPVSAGAEGFPAPWTVSGEARLDFEWDSNVERRSSSPHSSERRDGLTRLFLGGQMAYDAGNPWLAQARYEGGFKKFYRERDEDLAVQQITPELRYRSGAEVWGVSDQFKIKHRRDRAGEFVLNLANGWWTRAWSGHWLTHLGASRLDADFQDNSGHGPDFVNRFTNAWYDYGAWRGSGALIRRFSSDSHASLEYGYEHRLYPDGGQGQSAASSAPGETPVLRFTRRIDRVHRVSAVAEHLDSEDQWLLRAEISAAFTESTASAFGYRDYRVEAAWALPLGPAWYLDLGANFDLRRYRDARPALVDAAFREYILFEQEAEQLSSLSAEGIFRLNDWASLHAQAQHFFERAYDSETLVDFRGPSLYRRTLLDMGLSAQF